MARSARSRPPRLTQDAAVQPVIAAIRAERSILTGETSVCGTKDEFVAFAQEVTFVRFADLHLGLQTQNGFNLDSYGLSVQCSMWSSLKPIGKAAPR